jgi:hypothetical protein
MSSRNSALYVTIDVDWAHDDVIRDTLELLEVHGAKATWFATHASPVLDEIRAAQGHELALHPNFNPLFDGKGGTARDTVLRLKEIIPEARSVRSHSLVRSSRLAILFGEEGLTHESNVLIPYAVGSTVRPWRDVFGLVQVPIGWEDDVCLMNSAMGEPSDFLGGLPLVVDFHPIHVFLNTAALEDYETARPHFADVSELRRRRRVDHGTRTRFINLLSRAKAENAKFCLIQHVQVLLNGNE